MTFAFLQHDIIFDLLTVQEHLALFGGIKGVTGPELDNRITEMIDDLGLQEKRNVVASKLSVRRSSPPNDKYTLRHLRIYCRAARSAVYRWPSP